MRLRTGSSLPRQPIYLTTNSLPFWLTGELAASWPKERLVAIWNSLVGVRPVKRFANHPAAAGQIWARIQGLCQSAERKAEALAKPKAEPKAKRGARGAKGAPAKAKTGHKARTAKHPPQGKKAAKPQEAAAPRAVSKTAQVVAMLQRKGGATLTEIMQKMGWQKHTVRGTVVPAHKLAGAEPGPRRSSQWRSCFRRPSR
jgi:hypothetical protein